MKIRFGAFAVLLFALAIGCKTAYPVRVEPTLYGLNASYADDTSYYAAILPYKIAMDKEMGAVIGRSPQHMVVARPESLATNFLADGLHKKAEEYSGMTIDFAFQNITGIRVPYLPEGDITLGKMFEIMPFENHIAIVELDSAAMVAFINRMAADGGEPVSTGLRYEILYNKPHHIRIHGQPLSGKRTYKVATSDYIANGGLDYKFMIGRPRTILDAMLRDAFKDYIHDFQKAGKPIETKIDGRVVIVNE